MTQVPYYGMFSDEGNLAVNAIMQKAERDGSYWLEIYQALVNLAASDYEKFGEATDTMVREIAYEKYEQMCIARDNAKETV